MYQKVKNKVNYFISGVKINQFFNQKTICNHFAISSGYSNFIASCYSPHLSPEYEHISCIAICVSLISVFYRAIINSQLNFENIFIKTEFQCFISDVWSWSWHWTMIAWVCVFAPGKKMNNKPLNLNLLVEAGDGEESYSKYLSQLKLN